MLLLRKKKFIRHVLVDRTGDQKTDRIKLPASAMLITGVKAYCRLISLSVAAPDLTSLHYYFGNIAQPTVLPADIVGLTLGTYADLQPIFQVSSGAGGYIYYAHPATLSDPIFMYNGFQGGFLDRGTVNLALANGLVPHRVWRSTNPNLGNNVVIQAIH